MHFFGTMGVFSFLFGLIGAGIIIYDKVSKQQLKGNIYWNDVPKWESGAVYNARWEIDRANPKINLPQLYDIEFSLHENKLKMKLIENSVPYLSFDLKSIKSY